MAIIPGAGGTQKLPRIVGIAKAKELIFTGARFSGVEAHEMGIVNYVVDGYDEIINKSLEIAEKICKNVSIFKKRYRDLWGLETQNGLSTMGWK